MHISWENLPQVVELIKSKDCQNGFVPFLSLDRARHAPAGFGPEMKEANQKH